MNQNSNFVTRISAVSGLVAQFRRVTWFEVSLSGRILKTRVSSVDRLVAFQFHNTTIPVHTPANGLKCARLELVPPAILPPPFSTRTTTTDVSLLHREIFLVWLWPTRSHGHGEDTQGILVHLRAKVRDRRETVSANGAERRRMPGWLYGMLEEGDGDRA